MRFARTLSLAATAAAAATLMAVLPAQADSARIQVDPNLWSYTSNGTSVSGELSSVGSDTMNNLMTLLGRGLRQATTRTSTSRSRARARRPRRRP